MNLTHGLQAWPWPQGPVLVQLSVLLVQPSVHYLLQPSVQPAAAWPQPSVQPDAAWPQACPLLLVALPLMLVAWSVVLMQALALGLPSPWALELPWWEPVVVEVVLEQDHQEPLVVEELAPVVVEEEPLAVECEASQRSWTHHRSHAVDVEVAQALEDLALLPQHMHLNTHLRLATATSQSS